MKKNKILLISLTTPIVAIVIIINYFFDKYKFIAFILLLSMPFILYILSKKIKNNIYIKLHNRRRFIQNEKNITIGRYMFYDNYCYIMRSILT